MNGFNVLDQVYFLRKCNITNRAFVWLLALMNIEQKALPNISQPPSSAKHCPECFHVISSISTSCQSMILGIRQQNNSSRCFLHHVLSIQPGCLSYYVVCILTNIVKLSFNI